MNADSSNWHIVLFKFKQEVTQSLVEEVNRRLRALSHSTKKGKPYIKRILSGAQNSKEGLAGGYTLGFIMEFASCADRDFYVGKPIVIDDDYDKQHHEFKQFVQPLLQEKDGVFVFDFIDGQL